MTENDTSVEHHIEVFQATARGSGWPTAVSITGTAWEFKVDEPLEDGGGNSGPNPMHHFAASLALFKRLRRICWLMIGCALFYVPGRLQAFGGHRDQPIVVT